MFLKQGAIAISRWLHMAEISKEAKNENVRDTP